MYEQKIMKLSHLRNKFLSTKSETGRKVYIKQRNYCVTLITKAKQTFFGNIDKTDVTDSKIFWRTVKVSLVKTLKLVLLSMEQKIQYKTQ